MQNTVTRCAASGVQTLAVAMADTAALLEELRRSQDRLRKEVLSGQALILNEIRSLHQYWKDQLGVPSSPGPGVPSSPGPGAEAEKKAADGKGAKVARPSISEGLSKGLEEFTDSVVKNIEGLTSVFAENIGRHGDVPHLPTPKKRDSQSVRFAEQRVSLHRATLAGAEVEELLLDKEERPRSSQVDAAAFMPATREKLKREGFGDSKKERKRTDSGEGMATAEATQEDQKPATPSQDGLQLGVDAPNAAETGLPRDDQDQSKS
ncbi:unnamed protein product [Effrenium voratum]|uniref:Uncharacterized protein n=1 Tax=Effrenium voratum TaxID=2562239 RepID=A0AA36MVJ2_9DINO|nr:unnamed protein product [Effrenium voratum]